MFAGVYFAAVPFAGLLLIAPPVPPIVVGPVPALVHLAVHTPQTAVTADGLDVPLDVATLRVRITAGKRDPER